MADSGNTRAQCECGNIYENGGMSRRDTEINVNGKVLRVALRGFVIVEKDVKKATYYYDEATKGGCADAAWYAAKMYAADFNNFPETHTDQRKSLEYCIKGIKMGSRLCLNDSMRTYFCCDDEKINTFRQLLLKDRDEEAEEYLQWLIDNGYFLENGFYACYAKT